MSNKPKRAKQNPIDKMLRAKEARDQHTSRMHQLAMRELEKKLVQQAKMEIIAHRLREPINGYFGNEQNNGPATG